MLFPPSFPSLSAALPYVRAALATGENFALRIEGSPPVYLAVEAGASACPHEAGGLAVGPRRRAAKAPLVLPLDFRPGR
jgi:hypothetical protein